MVPSNGANAQRRVESACIGADSLPSAKRDRKTETLIPAILMVLQLQCGDRQWCKCTAAHLAFDSLNSALETERSKKCSSSMSQERTAVRKSECKQCN
jgi:hypothetical protein